MERAARAGWCSYEWEPAPVQAGAGPLPSAKDPGMRARACAAELAATGARGECRVLCTVQ